MTSCVGPYDRLRLTLTEMRALLLKHDCGQQEYVLTALRAVDYGDREIIRRSLNNAGCWGRSGSILDLILFDIPWTAEFERDVADDSRLTKSKLDLLMTRLGMAEPWALFA